MSKKIVPNPNRALVAPLLTRLVAAQVIADELMGMNAKTLRKEENALMLGKLGEEQRAIAMETAALEGFTLPSAEPMPTAPEGVEEDASAKAARLKGGVRVMKGNLDKLEGALKTYEAGLVDGETEEEPPQAETPPPADAPPPVEPPPHADGPAKKAEEGGGMRRTRMTMRGEKLIPLRDENPPPREERRAEEPPQSPKPPPAAKTRKDGRPLWVSTLLYGSLMLAAGTIVEVTLTFSKPWLEQKWAAFMAPTEEVAADTGAPAPMPEPATPEFTPKPTPPTPEPAPAAPNTTAADQPLDCSLAYNMTSDMGGGGKEKIYAVVPVRNGASALLIEGWSVTDGKCTFEGGLRVLDSDFASIRKGLKKALAGDVPDEGITKPVTVRERTVVCNIGSGPATNCFE